VILREAGPDESSRRTTPRGGPAYWQHTDVVHSVGKNCVQTEAPKNQTPNCRDALRLTDHAAASRIEPWVAARAA
jgi:hypothetical protein